MHVAVKSVKVCIVAKEMRQWPTSPWCRDTV